MLLRGLEYSHFLESQNKIYSGDGDNPEKSIQDVVLTFLKKTINILFFGNHENATESKGIEYTHDAVNEGNRFPEETIEEIPENAGHANMLTDEQKLINGFGHWGPLNLAFGKNTERMHYVQKDHISFRLHSDFPVATSFEGGGSGKNTTGININASNNSSWSSYDIFLCTGIITIFILCCIYTTLLTHHRIYNENLDLKDGEMKRDFRDLEVKICDKVGCAISGHNYCKIGLVEQNSNRLGWSDV